MPKWGKQKDVHLQVLNAGHETISQSLPPPLTKAESHPLPPLLPQKLPLITLFNQLLFPPLSLLRKKERKTTFSLSVTRHSFWFWPDQSLQISPSTTVTVSWSDIQAQPGAERNKWETEIFKFSALNCPMKINRPKTKPMIRYQVIDILNMYIDCA